MPNNVKRPTSVTVTAISGYEHFLETIKGDEPIYYRIDDKKDPERITETSKYQLVCISAKSIQVLTVGKKDNKFSATIMEYEDDEKWADAIRRLLSKKLIESIDSNTFLNTFAEFILGKLEGEV